MRVPGTIWPVASDSKVGIVGVNMVRISAAEAPFSGVTESGLGKVGRRYDLAGYQILKNTTLSI